MEAIAALSLTCNILQLVDTGSKAASCLRQVYKDGNTKHNYALRDASLSLSESLKEFQLCNIDQFKDDEREIYITGCQVAAVTEALQKLLESSTQHGQMRTRDKLKNSFKTMRAKSEVEELEVKLRLFQNTLDTTILLNLRKRFLLSEVQNSHDFNSLNTRLKNFIDSQAAIQRDEHLRTRDVIRQEGATTRADISAKIDNQDLAKSNRAAYHRLLSSLKFPDMNERQNTVDTAYNGTFEWILEGEDTRAQADEVSENTAHKDVTKVWANARLSYNRFQSTVHVDFTEWLTTSNKNFWICGKAGSGKSTLMGFIINHKSTKLYLESWAGGFQLNILQAYLWNVGSKLQRSYKGVLATILLQMLEIIEDETLEALKDQDTLFRKTQISDWRVEEIEDLLLTIVAVSSQRFCLFLDGLDELELEKRSEDDEILLRFLERVSAFNTFKCCLSSRPEPLFEHYFRATRSFRLENLNMHDIKKLIIGVLGESSSADLVKFGKDQSLQFQKLANDFVRKADGVFLWARLVLERIRRGLRNHENIHTLTKYLDSLPSDLADLYRHMWLKNNNDLPQHRREAAILFRLAISLSDGEMGDLYLYLLECYNIVQLAFILDDTLYNYTKVRANVEDVVHAAERVKQQIGLRSAGLLVVKKDDESFSESSFFVTEVEQLRHYKLGLIHRTAKDFLLSTPVGRDICLEGEIPTSAIMEKCLLALIEERSYLIDTIRLNWLREFTYLLEVFENHLSDCQTVEIQKRLDKACAENANHHLSLSTSSEYLREIAMCEIANHSMMFRNGNERVLPVLDLNGWFLAFDVVKSVSNMIQNCVDRIEPGYCTYLLCLLGVGSASWGTEFKDSHRHALVRILMERSQDADEDVLYFLFNPILDVQRGPSLHSYEHTSHQAIGLSATLNALRYMTTYYVLERLYQRSLSLAWISPLIHSLLRRIDLPQSGLSILLIMWDSQFSEAGVRYSSVHAVNYMEGLWTGFKILLEYNHSEVLRWCLSEGQRKASWLEEDYKHDEEDVFADTNWTIKIKGIGFSNLGPDLQWRTASFEDSTLLSTTLATLPDVPCPTLISETKLSTDDWWQDLIKLSSDVWHRSGSDVNYLDILAETGCFIPADDPRVLKKAPKMFIDDEEDIKDVDQQSSQPITRPLRSMTGFSDNEDAEDDFVDASEELERLSLDEYVTHKK